MKSPRLIDPEEIDVYETDGDRIAIGAFLLLLITSIAIIIWEPDVEAIGEWVWNLTK